MEFIVNQNRLEQWCKERNIPVPKVELVDHIEPCEFGWEPAGTYSWPNKIQIRIRDRKIPRRLSENKKKRILKSLNSTLYHELRHHYQAKKMRDFYRSGRTGEYYSRPIEVDARAYQKKAMSFGNKPIIDLA